jgi:hypothetical protein
MNREILPEEGARERIKWIGVSHHPRTGKYRSFIYHPVTKKTINFGSHATAYEAAKRRFFELQTMPPEISSRISTDFVPDVNDHNAISRMSNGASTVRAPSPISLHSNMGSIANAVSAAAAMSAVPEFNDPSIHAADPMPYPNKYDYMNMMGLPYQVLHNAENRFYEELNSAAAENEEMANFEPKTISNEFYGILPNNSSHQFMNAPKRSMGFGINNDVEMSQPEPSRKRLFSNAEGGSRKRRRNKTIRKRRYLSSARSQRYKK